VPAGSVGFRDETVTDFAPFPPVPVLGCYSRWLDWRGRGILQPLDSRVSLFSYWNIAVGIGSEQSRRLRCSLSPESVTIPAFIVIAAIVAQTVRVGVALKLQDERRQRERKAAEVVSGGLPPSTFTFPRLFFKWNDQPSRSGRPKTWRGVRLHHVNRLFLSFGR